MNYRIARSFLVASCMAALAAWVAPFSQALGQPRTIDEVADFITNNHFSINHVIAKPGIDWCVQVETDPTEEWWPILTPTTTSGTYDFTNHQSLYGNRIRLFYTSTDGKAKGFASIFMAIDFGNPYPPYNPNLLSLQVKNPSAGHPALGSIDFPKPGPSTICPDFRAFLTIAFQGEFYGWEPTGGNPEAWLLGCDPTAADCVTVPWDFLGREHRISGMIRFSINIYFTKKDQYPDPGGKPNPHTGFLTVGFGGNGGAG